MKPPPRPARGAPSGSPPAHPFYRFGKHYRAGLQAPERVSVVRIQGSEASGQSVKQSLGGHAAKSLSGDGGCSLAATRRRRPQLSRPPVDFKHEGCVWLAEEPFVGFPRSRATPSARNRSAMAAAATCLVRWLGPGPSSKKAPRARIGPLWAALVSQLALRPATVPVVSKSVSKVARPLARPRA